MKEKYAKLMVNLLLWAAGIVLLFTVVPRLLLFLSLIHISKPPFRLRAAGSTRIRS